MRENFDYDVFISFSHHNGDEVQKLYSRLLQFNLKVFWSEEKLTSGIGFTEEIQNALKKSQHFVLYYSSEASESNWVKKEWQTFYDKYHLPSENNRRMYILLIKPVRVGDIPSLLSGIHRPKDQVTLISDLVKEVYINSEKELQETTLLQEKEIRSLEEKLNTEIEKGTEARDYYRHNRFWRPITERKDVYIFTCARDTSDDPNNKRGRGGRTNIDMWDYRSVFDIIHFFASNYPSTRVTIVDPVSKLGGNDLKEAIVLADRISHMRSMLENKDCIIIGSPDVSDFAEIVLAELHQISPFSQGREKRKGFVIIKEKKHTSSAFYWEKEPHEKEGIVHVRPNDFEYSSNVIASENGTIGEMYGMLVVANNPFCKKEKQSKIIILSGFSGIATNAVAKILTNEECLEEFFKLDKAYENLEKPIEVLIGVKYIIDRNFKERDTRKIEKLSQDITFGWCI